MAPPKGGGGRQHTEKTVAEEGSTTKGESSTTHKGEGEPPYTNSCSVLHLNLVSGSSLIKLLYFINISSAVEKKGEPHKAPPQGGEGKQHHPQGAMLTTTRNSNSNVAGSSFLCTARV